MPHRKQEVGNHDLVENGIAGLDVSWTLNRSVASQQQRRAILPDIVARHCGVDPDDIRVTHGATGEPIVHLNGRRRFVSTSNRGDLFLLGTAELPVGVDLEPIGEATEPPWNVLAPSERDDLEAIADRLTLHIAFLRIWTVKEAVAKALGVGFRREPASLPVTIRDDTIAVLDMARPLPLRFARTGIVDHASGRFVWSCVVLADASPSAPENNSQSGLRAEKT